MDGAVRAKIASQRIVLASLIIIFVGLWIFGVRNFYFHQDDVISLAMVAREWPSVMWRANAEHVNVIFFALLYLEWRVFGLNYPGYLAVSLCIWAMILWLVYRIVKGETKSSWYGVMAIGVLAINRNWGEMVWWVTGQAMMGATLLALFSWYYKLYLDKQRRVWTLWQRVLWGISLILPGLSWGGGLIWPFVVLIFWGWERRGERYRIILPEAWLATGLMWGIYRLIAKESVGLHFSPSSWLESPIQIILFVGVGIVENVLGRWVLPIQNLWVENIALILIGWWWVGWGRKSFEMSRKTKFAWGVAILSMVAYAIPRWQFGLGQAMAERYAFQPLIFLVIGIAIGYKKWKISRLRVWGVSLVVIYFMIVGSWGFGKKARTWRERPLQVKAWFGELGQIQRGKCYPNEYLPDFLVEADKFRIDYIWPIFKKNFNPWDNSICQ